MACGEDCAKGIGDAFLNERPLSAGNIIMRRFLKGLLHHPAGERRGWFVRLLDRVIPLLSIASPHAPQLLRRIEVMERDIILPLKAAGILMLMYSFYFRPWINNVLSALEVAVEWTQYFLWLYILANVVFGLLILNMKRLPLEVARWFIFANCLLDGLFLSALTLVTGGYDSFLYWFFPPLIVRSAVSVPRATSQTMLNLTLCSCYVLAGFLDISIASYLDIAGYLDQSSLARSGLSDPGSASTEPLVLRVVVLCLMAVCSYGLQVLLERQRQAQEEAREFAVREAQLRSAGRMAAEFAHQMKNPLAIINTASFSLKKALNNGRGDPTREIRIIQEEVERSDRIITQLMGYAHLSEGRVEKLDVAHEVECAIKRVFPEGAGFAIKVEKEIGPDIPPLLMQRRHLEDTLLNLLQNARDALEEQRRLKAAAGEAFEPVVWLRASRSGENSVGVIVEDNGPGIPAEKHKRVFEAYYSTKEKGTGLGLATVKHNVQLYAGTVQLESELGKGARFRLTFPSRSLDEIPAGP